jgi:ribonucleotide reductase alpha subunit
MLQTLGVQSKVVKMRDACQTLLPDGKGGRKLFDCKPLWRILISSSGLYRLKSIGFACNRLVFAALKPQRNAEQFVTVTAVFDNDRYDNTYCFNEPENHAGIFNGILTGNCTEIMEVSTPGETAVCNLASLSLPAFVISGAGAKPGEKNLVFDFDELRKVTRQVIENLNRVIDINFYPTEETRTSNMRNRPVGLGIQGLADVFAMMKIDWETPEAADLNQRIFENIYYAALEESARLAEVEGAYETFAGSPASQGILQHDMWKVVPITQNTLDWDGLHKKAARGLRNSLLVAPMPTASTSQVLGNNECFEPFTGNLYTRRTLAGEFIIVNKYLMKDLLELGIWNEAMKQQIIARNGSVQGIDTIPMDIQQRYKTAYEIKQRVLIDMAAARGAFIDQSQSLNLFVADPNYAKLTSMHFHAWRAGLKTGCYYLRTKAPVMAQKFTIDPRLLAAVTSGGDANEEMSKDDDHLSMSTDSDDESQEPSNAERKRKERAALLDHLAAEYEEEKAKAKAAADAGDGCLMCSG